MSRKEDIVLALGLALLTLMALAAGAGLLVWFVMWLRSHNADIAART